MESTKYVGVLEIMIAKCEKMPPPGKKLLTQHGYLIIGRMGLLYGNRGMHIISLIVDGSRSGVEAFATAVKAIPDTIVESTISPVCVD